MNFSDMINRRDPAVKVLAGSVNPRTIKTSLGPRRAVELSGGCRFRLSNAQEMTYLRSFPRSPGWHVVKGAVWGGGSLEISIVPEGGEPRLLARTTRNRQEIVLDWPPECARSGAFHLEFLNRGSRPLHLEYGEKHRARDRLIPMLRGDGVEVGPGLSPRVQPSDQVSVRYVERTSPEEWLSLYSGADRDDMSRDDVSALFSRYIRGDAAKLDGIEDRSLDFIFSSHVFEHLSNPLGVLENWSRKLKPGGLIAGIVPDSRFCFDLRQPPSTVAEMLDERRNRMWEMTEEKFARWCRYSSPYADPKALKESGYSVHAHFYTPDNFRDMADLLVGEETIKSVFLDAAPNNKDFGFALWV